MIENDSYIRKFVRGEGGFDNETIDKILAGYWDSDGTVFIYHDKKIALKSTLTQSATNDPDFEIVRAFHRHYGLGCLIYKTYRRESWASSIEWCLSVNDTKALFKRIGKHMVIKAQRFDYYINTYDENRGTEVDLKSIRSKQPIGPLVPKDSTDPAWLSGYIAGDGSFDCRLGRIRRRYVREKNSYRESSDNILKLSITCEERSPLDYLKEYMGGSVYDNKEKTHYTYHRGLGKTHSQFSIPFLESIKPYMLHVKKYDKIQRMLEFLNQTKD